MPVLTASGAGVRHHRRWLFRDLDLTVEPGEIVAVTGPPGSGRTTLLLALAGRFRLNAGKVTAEGTVALGHVPGVAEPEPVFTVAEHVRERLALLGRPRRDAEGTDLRGLDPRALGRDLTPYQKQVLGVVLAGLAGPALIALDGFGDGLDARERADLWALLTEIAAGGTAVLFTAREADPADVSTVVSLAAAPEHREAGVPTRGADGGPVTQASEGASDRSEREAAPEDVGGRSEREAAPEDVGGRSEREAAPEGVEPGAGDDLVEGVDGGVEAGAGTAPEGAGDDETVGLR